MLPPAVGSPLSLPTENAFCTGGDQSMAEAGQASADAQAKESATAPALDNVSLGCALPLPAQASAPYTRIIFC